MCNLILRAMTDAGFVDYRHYSNRFRGAELASAFGHAQSDAVALADAELNECLPKGLETAGNYLQCIVHNELGLIGYLWYGFTAGETEAFLFDFQVFEAFRGRGFGRRVFAQLEQQLSCAGVKQIQLLVAYNNQRAASLYRELGFSPTGINMVKPLVS